ncbi:MAG: DUF2490 domain-containing protein [Flavobacterium sp.]|uniref:DUF2490 domain-containing protein n=1 Tax=Flavobacterium sp. TaxID=239 RepID=UPI0022BCCBC5|nr:DUF2490 domain-containing protein [Flavobacterium sp.]MCZ8196734.1 DUF2490 domain-containing protein [Flavobacterium sp.]
MTNLVRFYLIVCISFTSISFAQKSEVGNWLIYFGNQAINKKWNWHNEVQYRSFNFIDDTNQLLLRTGIGYNLSENNNNLLLGYGFINTQRYVANSDEKDSFNEHRIYQQFITRQNFGRVYLQHRYRLEERFLPDDFQLRFRYFLALNLPLNKKTMEKDAIYLSAYNEMFINTESPIFDRNRLYGALGYVINKNFKVEAGFMAQTLEKTNRNQFQIVIFNNLPF